MNNENYKRNLRFFKNISANFYKTLCEGTSQFEFKVSQVEDQNNLQIESLNAKLYLNSVYSIERELDETFKLLDDKTETLILYGIGNGYALEYIQEKFKNVHTLIIVEPSLQIFKEYLHFQSVDKIAKKFNRVEFIINENVYTSIATTAKILSESVNTKVQFVSQIAYRTLFEEHLIPFVEILKEHISRMASSAFVGNKATYKSIVNSIKNIRQNNVPLGKVMEQFEGKPIILVSAGPSLNKNMHLLEKAKDKAFIIAAGTAAKILDAAGIKPHFVAAFSPSEDEMIVFEHLTDKSIPLIYADIVYHKVVSQYDGPKFSFVSSSNFVSDYIMKKTDIPYTSIMTESTIANVILEIACNAKCSEVIFVGQDLAFTDKQRYATGAIQKFSMAGKEKSYILTKDIFGEDIYTMRAFQQIKASLENTITKNNTKTKFSNATEGGLHIEGTTIVKLEDKIGELPQIGLIDNIILEATKTRVNDDEYSEKIERAIGMVRDEERKIYEINEKRADELKEMIQIKDRENKLNELFNRIVKINKLEEELKKIPLYRDVAQKQLEIVFSTIVRAFRYDGKDQVKQLEAAENILVKTTLEMQKFCGLFEHFADRKDEIETEESNEPKENKDIDLMDMMKVLH